MTATTKRRTTQVASGSVAMAAAVLVAWGAQQMGVEMPEPVVVALSAVIGWAAGLFTDR